MSSVINHWCCVSAWWYETCKQHNTSLLTITSLNNVTFWSNADHSRMRAFHHAWSLPVTWQRWLPDQSIFHSWKPHDTHNPQGSIFYKIRVMGEQNFTLCEQEFLTFLLLWPWPLTQWPSYTNLTHIPWRYTGCANMNFLHQGFRKLSSDSKIIN